MESNFYAELGVPFDASAEEVRNAYFRLARELHPDVNSDASAQESFIVVKKAYETLSNQKLRAEYDSSFPPEIRQGPAVSIGVRFSQSSLHCMREPQLVYALVDLICTADSGKDRLSPCHICLVLDKSTSMAGPRMDMVKASSLNLLQQLRSQDLLSVVAFSDRAEVLIPPSRASSLSKSDHRISLLQTGGGTEILQGLRLGIEQLGQGGPNQIRHLVLLTDGHTYGDEDGCIQLAREAAQAGISITVLGIGHEWNDTLMDQISALSGGNALYISTPRDLDNFLMQKLADMEMVYARGIKFEFEGMLGIRMRYAFRLAPNIGPLDAACPVFLGDIHHRKSLSVLFEFEIPPLVEEMDRVTLAAGNIWMDIPGWSHPHARMLLDLHLPSKKGVGPEAPPAVLLEAMSKLTLYRLQEKVRQEVSEGQVEKATRHMHYLATHLLSQGDRELAHTVLIEAEHIQQSRRFSGDGEKRIKYGTRSLMLPSGPELRP
jgi:Ca-activated chloride channel family protein